MSVVSDTTAITYLYQVGQLSLLEQLFSEICVPQAVALELEVSHPGLIGRTSFLRLVDADAATCLAIAADYPELDRGELEAIAFAYGEGSRLVIIDEVAGRNACVNLGLPKTGLLGILEKSKERRLIAEVRPVAESVVERGLRVRPALLAAFLAGIGE